jgi:hypothetical protein
VCAYHWASGKKPFDQYGSDDAKAAILKAEYDKEVPQLTKNPKHKAFEKASFVPNLRELCEGLMTLDPAQRLGVADGGYDTLKVHPFFDGLDWGKLYVGAIEPPI